MYMEYSGYFSYSMNDKTIINRDEFINSLIYEDVFPLSDKRISMLC